MNIVLAFVILASLYAITGERRSDGSVAAVEQAAIQASCETRRLWGQQAQAFSAAALPLCRQV